MFFFFLIDNIGAIDMKMNQSVIEKNHSIAGVAFLF